MGATTSKGIINPFNKELIMVNKNHVSYDWELFLETQSLEAIDNFINYMSQYRSAKKLQELDECS